MAVEGFDTTIGWSGFVKRKAQGNDGDDAETIARYRAATINFQQKGAGVAVKDAVVTIRLDTKQSWVIEGKETAYLLKHEQGHYDITALAAREYYRSLFLLNATDNQGLQEEIAKLGERIATKIDNANARYDEQTDHSNLKPAQEKWNKAFAAEKQKADGGLDNLP